MNIFNDIYYIGLDVHKNYSTYAIMDKEGNLLKEGNLINNELSTKLPSFIDGRKILAMKTTRNWYAIYDMMHLKINLIRFILLTHIRQR